MPVAVLSDIHANLAALDAVLAECMAAGVEQYIFLGDFVGYYYQPAEVLARVRGLAATAILGNHDSLLLAARHDSDVRSAYLDRYGHGIEVALDTLVAEDWAWLEGLDEQRTVTLGERIIHLAHGAPFDSDFYIYPNADPARLALALGVQADAVWLGHTHWPMVVPGRPALLNPGSVGQPRDIGGLAAWALYHPETGSIALRRTEFATGELVAEARQRDGQLTRNADILMRGRLGC